MSAHPSTAVKQTACPLDCPDACSLEVTVEEGRVAKIDASPSNPLTAGLICGKVRRMARHVYSDERVLSPLLRRGPKGEGVFEPCDWDEALDLVAAKLLEVRERSGGEAILPLCYGGSNGWLSQDATDALLFERLGASVLERTVCAVPTSMAASAMYGRMHGVAWADYEQAELIVLWGVNPSASGIHLVPHVKRAQERGAKLVVIDPRRTPLAKRADLHLAPRPGTDLGLALAVAQHLFESGAADERFLSEHASEVDVFRERARAWSLERAAREADLELADLRAFAQLYAGASPAVIRCGWGLERNRNGGSAAAAVLALPAIAGKFGVRGGGYTMSNGGVWRHLAPRGIQSQARVVNMTRVGRALCELDDPAIEAVFVYNCNPISTLPHQNLVRRGFERADLFTVVFDAVLTDSARYADVVLPATTFLEHDELRAGYGATVLQRGRPVIEPVAGARSNLDVFAELCRRTGVAREGDPLDAESVAARLLGRDQRFREGLPADERGAELALPAEGLAPVQFVDVRPGTADGRVHLVPEELDRGARGGLYGYEEDPGTKSAPLALLSPALGELVTSTFGQLLKEEARLQMHTQDASERGLTDGQEVRVWNELGEVRCALAVGEEVRPGTVVLPKGYWDRHTRGGGTSNALCPDTYTDVGDGACYNDARVEVGPVTD